MGYIISLVIGLVSVLAVFGGPLHVWDKVKGSAINIVSPEPRELKLLDSLKEHQDVLGAFIKDATATLPKNATAAQRNQIFQAQEALNDSQTLLGDLQQQIKEDAPGIVTTIVKKFLGSELAEPTSIPPQCDLVCK